MTTTKQQQNPPPNPFAKLLRSLKKTQADFVRAAGGTIAQGRVNAMHREIATKVGETHPQVPRAAMRERVHKVMLTLTPEGFPPDRWDRFDRHLKALRALSDKRVKSGRYRKERAA